MGSSRVSPSTKLVRAPHRPVHERIESEQLAKRRFLRDKRKEQSDAEVRGLGKALVSPAAHRRAFEASKRGAAKAEQVRAATAARKQGRVESRLCRVREAAEKLLMAAEDDASARRRERRRLQEAPRALAQATAATAWALRIKEGWERKQRARYFALFLAVREGDLEAVRAAVAGGGGGGAISVNSRIRPKEFPRGAWPAAGFDGEKEDSPLHLAVRYSSGGMAQLLLSLGANPEQTNGSGETARSLAEAGGDGGGGGSGGDGRKPDRKGKRSGGVGKQGAGTPDFGASKARLRRIIEESAALARSGSSVALSKSSSSVALSKSGSRAQFAVGGAAVAASSLSAARAPVRSPVKKKQRGGGGEERWAGDVVGADHRT